MSICAIPCSRGRCGPTGNVYSVHCGPSSLLPAPRIDLTQCPTSGASVAALRFCPHSDRDHGRELTIISIGKSISLSLFEFPIWPPRAFLSCLSTVRGSSGRCFNHFCIAVYPNVTRIAHHSTEGIAPFSKQTPH